MSEKKEKGKKLKGLAKILDDNLSPLNQNKKFKEEYKDADIKILINAVDGRWAALIKIIKGIIEVEGVRNNKEEITKEKLGWDGKLETTTEILLNIAMGKISTLSFMGKLITRKIKIKNMKKVMVLTNLFALL